jgi:hypothetical protein
LPASVTNATWLPSMFTAGAHDAWSPATGNRCGSSTERVADTIDSGAPRGGSSKMPLPSVSRSKRKICVGHPP